MTVLRDHACSSKRPAFVMSYIKVIKLKYFAYVFIPRAILPAKMDHFAYTAFLIIMLLAKASYHVEPTAC